MAKKSMIEKALDSGKQAGAAAGGFLGASLIENTVAQSLGTETTAKRLGVRVGVPLAAGVALRQTSTNEHVQAAGLGAMVRAGVNAGGWLIGLAKGATNSSDGDEAVEGRRQHQGQVGTRRAQRRQLTDGRQQREKKEERRIQSGVLGPRSSAGFQTV